MNKATFSHHPAFKFHEKDMGGNLWRFEFDNGYGASVICHDGSYGHEKGLFELAVTKEGKLDYSTPIANDVIGWLTREDVFDLLEKIKELPVPFLRFHLCPSLKFVGWETEELKIGKN